MTTLFLINKLPSTVSNVETPIFKLHGAHPDYSSLRVFVCRCFPYLQDHNKNKFEPKTQPYIFIGYSPLHKGFQCYHPDSQKFFISRHVVFYEIVFPYKNSQNVQIHVQEPSTITTFSDFIQCAIPNGEPKHIPETSAHQGQAP